MEGNRKDGHTLPSPSLSLFDEERKRINTILLLYALEQLGDQRIGFELTDIIHKTFPNGSEWSVEHTCLQRQDFLWESLVLCWQTKEMKNKRRKCTWYCSPIRSAIWRPIGLFIFTRVCIKEIPNSKNMIGNINLEQLKQS